jgi:hypothetical protein
MPTLSVACSSFPSAYTGAQGQQSVPVTEEQLLKYAWMIGQTRIRHAVPTDEHAVFLSFYKALAVKCAVDFTSGSIGRPPQYQAMDPSEKSNISAWTGMTFASLVADVCLGVPQLSYAEALRRQGRIVRGDPTSRSLADLAGVDHRGDWHVVEAKARQMSISGTDRTKWERQAQTIGFIDGRAPLTRSYCVTNVGNTYAVSITDPEGDDVDPVDLEVGPTTLVRAYYGPLTRWLSRQGSEVSYEGVPLIVGPGAFDAVANNYVFLGMRPEVYRLAQDELKPDALDSIRLRSAFVGSDGIAVITSPEPRLA